MSSEGWRTLLSKDWADCVVHNLPFYIKNEKKQSLSICGWKDSAATWNFYEIVEKSGSKDIRRS